MTLSQEPLEIERIKALIQSRLGKFLALRETLLNIRNFSLDLNIRTKAEALLSIQSDLEKELSNGLKIMENIDRGVYSMSDLITLGTLSYGIEKQINDVSDLEKEYVSGPKEETKMTGFELLVLSLIGGVLVYAFTRGRK